MIVSSVAEADQHAPFVVDRGRRSGFSAFRLLATASRKALSRILAQKCPNREGRADPLCPGTSDIHLFGDSQGVVDLNTEITDRAFDLSMAKQALNGAKIAGTPIDESGLGSPQRMDGETSARVESPAASRSP
jgi:hypothetical protein